MKLCNHTYIFYNNHTFLRLINKQAKKKLYAISKIRIKQKLTDDDKVNLELLQYSIEDELSSYKFKAYLNPILADEGFHTDLAYMGSEILSSKKEFDNYIKKLKDIPRYVDENISLMRKGLALGICQPRSILNGYENTYEQHIVTDPQKSIFWKPFLQKPFGINEEEWKRILKAGEEAVQHYAVKGFKNIKTFFDTEYLPKTRTSIGVSNFPGDYAVPSTILLL